MFGVRRLRVLAVVLAIGTVVLSPHAALAADEQGQSTRTSDGVLVFCYATDLAFSQPTPTTFSLARSVYCDQPANIYIDISVTKDGYPYTSAQKGPFTYPNCQAVTYCDLVLNGGTAGAGWYQATAHASFAAAPSGNWWSFSTKGVTWYVSGGPQAPAP